MKATWNEQLIAESEQTIEVDGYVYFPRDTVRMDIMKQAEKSGSDLECPHGVQFYDLSDSGKQSPRAAWSYEAPGERMKKVDHWIGFWRDVKVSS
jgi:uncharacterized protein (DUF427 family)